MFWKLFGLLYWHIFRSATSFLFQVYPVKWDYRVWPWTLVNPGCRTDSCLCGEYQRVSPAALMNSQNWHGIWLTIHLQTKQTTLKKLVLDVCWEDKTHNCVLILNRWSYQLFVLQLFHLCIYWKYVYISLKAEFLVLLLWMAVLCTINPSSAVWQAKTVYIWCLISYLFTYLEGYSRYRPLDTLGCTMYGIKMVLKTSKTQKLYISIFSHSIKKEKSKQRHKTALIRLISGYKNSFCFISKLCTAFWSKRAAVFG